MQTRSTLPLLSLALLVTVWLAACDFSEQNVDWRPGDSLGIEGPSTVVAPQDSAEFYVQAYTIDKNYSWTVDGESATSRRGGEYLTLSLDEPGLYTITVNNGENTGVREVTYHWLTFEGQGASDEVTVDGVLLPEGGFVVIHDSTLADDALGSVIGVSQKLDAGFHEDVEISLFTGVPGQTFDMDALQNDQTLIAMPHLDSNANGAYDFVSSSGAEDGPYLKKDGTPEVASADIAIPEDDQ